MLGEEEGQVGKEKMKNRKPKRKPYLLSQGISGSIPLEAENTEYLSHTYF